MKTIGTSAVLLAGREFRSETYAAIVQGLSLQDCLRVNREAWKLAELGVATRRLCIDICVATFQRLRVSPDHACTNRVRRINAVLRRCGAL